MGKQQKIWQKREDTCTDKVIIMSKEELDKEEREKARLEKALAKTPVIAEPPPPVSEGVWKTFRTLDLGGPSR